MIILCGARRADCIRTVYNTERTVAADSVGTLESELRIHTLDICSLWFHSLVENIRTHDGGSVDFQIVYT